MYIETIENNCFDYNGNPIRYVADVFDEFVRLSVYHRGSSRLLMAPSCHINRYPDDSLRAVSHALKNFFNQYYFSIY